MADTGEETFSLAEAARLTGYTQANFRTKRTRAKLAEISADAQGPGKAWKLTKRDLVALGFLNEDFSVKDRRGGAGGSRTGDHATDLAVLADELTKAQAQEEHLRADLASIRKRLKQLRAAEVEYERLKPLVSAARARTRAVRARYERLRDLALEEAESAARDSADKLARIKELLGIDEENE